MNTGAATAAILAHQGGWDEMLMIVVPIAAVVLLLRVVKRRVEAQQTPTADGQQRSTDAPSDANRPTKSS
ncbi:MAG: hypothetical protein WCO88_04135 [Actinomycetota bacterium]